MVAVASDHVKARGAFYTPEVITEFLARWAIRDRNAVVLEPSAGDGAFLQAAVARFAALGRENLADHLIGVEPEPAEAMKCLAAAPSARIHQADFFELMPEDLPAASAVLGNPPYIRYHMWTGVRRERAQRRAREHGVELSSLSSSWAGFVIHASQFLISSGRLALVLPAELLSTDYADPVRRFLTRRFASVGVIAFDRAAFRSASVDALLLLAGPDGPKGLHLEHVATADELAKLLSPEPWKQPDISISEPSGRWTSALNPEAAELYEELAASPRTQPLGEVGSVDIGVVTGADRFFVVDRASARHRGIPRSLTTPIVRRPRAVAGLAVRHDETDLLLDLRGRAGPLPEKVVAYLDEGEVAGINGRYKCGRRMPWYAVPLPRTRPDAFFRYMNHDAARLIVNSADSWSTNLMHGVVLKPDAPVARALSAAMLSSVSRLSAEIEGRSYGGGVLKLETKEAERVLVPVLKREEEADLVRLFPELDVLVRNGRLNDATERVDLALGFDHERLHRAAASFGRRRTLRRSGIR